MLVMSILPATAAQAPRASVETLAGPGFCDGATVIDSTPGRVGALAIDHDGRVYTDLVDAPGRGVIRVVDGTHVTQLISNEPVTPSTDPLAGAALAPAAARLAVGDGGEGVVVAAGSRVIEVDADPPSLRGIAGVVPGQPAGPTVSAGDGGPATAARFGSARSVASDATQNLYIADQIDPATAAFVVRFVNRGTEPVTFYQGTAAQLTVAPGHIETIAGAAGALPRDGGGSARDASLVGVPPSMAVAPGRLYVASYSGRPGSGAAVGSVRVVNLGGEQLTVHGTTVGPGMIETVAGGPGTSDADGGPARDALLSYIPAVAADDTGGLFIVEQLRNRVRFVGSDGRISTFAGSPDVPASLGVAELDRPATQAVLDRPVDVKVGAGRRVFIADEGSGRVLVVDGAGLIHLASGSARPGICATVRGPGSAGERERPAEGQPYSVVAGEHGDTYFVNLLARRVMKRDSSGTTSVLMRAGDSCPGVAPCTPARSSELRWPAALAFSQHGLYIYDVIGARVLFSNLGSRPERVNGRDVGVGELAVLAGDGTAGMSGDGGRAVDAQLGGQGATEPGSTPQPPSLLLTEGAVGDIAVDRRGNLYIGDGANGRVRLVNRDGTISSVAGNGAPSASQGCCTMPSGLALDAFGNLYVSDMATRQVWFVNRAGVAVEAHGQSVLAGSAVPVAGTGRRGFGGDGRALETDLYQPTGVVADGRGNLYIAEYRDQTIRRLDASGSLTTVAGIGAGGFNGDGLPPRQSALFNPTDVALDSCGNLLVADFRNDRIRRINLVAPCDVAIGADDESGRAAVPALPVVAGATVVGVSLGAVVTRRSRRRFPVTR